MLAAARATSTMAQATSTGLGLGLGFVDIRVRVRARVSVRVRFCGHYVDIVAGNCGRLRLQPTVTQNCSTQPEFEVHYPLNFVIAFGIKEQQRCGYEADVFSSFYRVHESDR